MHRPTKDGKRFEFGRPYPTHPHRKEADPDPTGRGEDEPAGQPRRNIHAGAAHRRKREASRLDAPSHP